MKNSDIISLFRGIGIIIDENIGNVDSHDTINKIHKYLINKNFPILSYSSIPQDEIIKNFRNACFVVLDWNLHNQDIIPQPLIDENIHFIEEINRICFIPIFIFTNEEPHDIELALSEKGLFYEDKNNNVFVKSKSEIKSGKILFSTIANWVRKVPSIYVLKQWENNTQLATSVLFHELNSISSDWISIMLDTYLDDVGKDNSEIGNFIFNNLITTCTPLKLDQSLIHRNNIAVEKNELRQLLERERFLKCDKLMDYPAMGDVFKVGRKYYLNFRADCDLVRQDNPELYLVEGKVIREQDINKRNSRYKFEKGAFLDRVNFAVVPFIHNGMIVEFKFDRISIENWLDKKGERVGRLLPPYSTRLKLQLMAYLQRQAIPSIPNKAIRD